jgi:hypothetical protein
MPFLEYSHKNTLARRDREGVEIRFYCRGADSIETRAQSGAGIQILRKTSNNKGQQKKGELNEKTSFSRIGGNRVRFRSGPAF